MVELAQFKLFCHKVQLMAAHIRQHSLTEDKGVQPVVGEVYVIAGDSLVNHGGIE